MERPYLVHAEGTILVDGEVHLIGDTKIKKMSVMVQFENQGIIRTNFFGSKVDELLNKVENFKTKGSRFFFTGPIDRSTPYTTMSVENFH